MTKREFVNKFWKSAQGACQNTPINPVMVMAAAAVESRWGDSGLTKEANNFFGIKSTDSWEKKGGEFVTKSTREVVKGKSIIIAAKFRKYANPTECFMAYVQFLHQPRYVRAGVLDATTPEQQIKAVAAAGYATDPKYAETIIAVMVGLKTMLA